MDSYVAKETHPITDAIATPDQRHAKPSWYSILKGKPEAFAKFKKTVTEKYNAT